MALSFKQKTKLNRTILNLLRLRLVNKSQRILTWPGDVTLDQDPGELSLMGSVGHAPSPDFDRLQQAPNAMGMVLLVKPNQDNHLALAISGQFDIYHRIIPSIDEMRRDLMCSVDGTPRDKQSLAVKYRRITVIFDNAPLTIHVPDQTNQWVHLPPENTLQSALNAVQAQFRADELTFREIQTNDRDRTLTTMKWEDDRIFTDDDLIATVQTEFFKPDGAVMPWDVNIRARIRPAPPSLANPSEKYLLEIYLENHTSRDTAFHFGFTKSAHLLDVEFQIKLVKGEAFGLPHRLEPAEYRHESNSTVPGYGITTSVKAIGNQCFSTDAMPISEQEKIDNPSPSQLGMQASPDFLALANDPFPILDGLIQAVDRYMNEWQLDINKMSSNGKEEQAKVSRQDLAKLHEEKISMQNGINLLRQHEHLLRCFKWMNEAMHNGFKQQKRSITTWRLFQLGFILTQIRAIYERHCDEMELTDHIQTAEVLWFATGGGKTEAYLGIITMAMLYDRLKGRLYGTTAWMKFPLRMLSVQQFQRLAYVIAQANIIRETHVDELAGHPFTIGYFTGTGTPRKITSLYEDDKSTFLPHLDADILKTWRFIHDCPYCDAENSVVVEKSIAQARIKHVCQNQDCWSNATASSGQHGEGMRGELGIYVSDEEVYRYIPTVMVGIIDKLATIAHNTRYRHFFGACNFYCPTHGFIIGGNCDHNILVRKDNGEFNTEPCPNNSMRSKVRTVPLAPMSPSGISFVIQDELHLLKENVGNFDAHYETLMSALQTGNGGRPPKILSATATIKGYEHHINHLYLRHARRFPAPGLKRSESFYSRVDFGADGQPLIRRLYAGILPIGTGTVMERAAAFSSTRYLELIDDLVEKLQFHPKDTCQRLGFSSTDAVDLKNHIQTYLNACLIYINSIRGTSNVNRHLEEDQAPRHPDWKTRQLDSKTSLDKIQDAIYLIEHKTPDNPTRQLIATSVVSHGVDMSRLNFMVVGGWPKTISEYIQSSARAGREQPGIILSVLNSKLLFQNNVFLNFEDYHRFIDRMVESVPVNRFAPNLLQRTLPGVVLGTLNNWAVNQPWGADINKNGGKLKEAINNSAMGVRDAIKQQLLQALEIPQSMMQQGLFDTRVVNDFQIQLEHEINYILDLLARMNTDLSKEYISDVIERLMGNRAMINLRDIESQVMVKPRTREAVDLLQALARMD